jgi:hypothetical protein
VEVVARRAWETSKIRTGGLLNDECSMRKAQTGNFSHTQTKEKSIPRKNEPKILENIFPIEKKRKLKEIMRK